MDISLGLRTKLAKPERRTGVVYMFITRIHDAGLALCPLAKPLARVANRALLLQFILCIMLGKFPLVDLTMPTCSASELNGILFLTRLTGDTSFQYSAVDSRPGPLGFYLFHRFLHIPPVILQYHLEIFPFLSIGGSCSKSDHYLRDLLWLFS